MFLMGCFFDINVEWPVDNPDNGVDVVRDMMV